MRPTCCDPRLLPAILLMLPIARSAVAAAPPAPEVAPIRPAAWRQEADARIRDLRRRPVRVRVADELGRPVEGVPIEVRQTAKAFPFGAAISAEVLRNERYREFFLAHFNWAVFENELKWYANERRPGQESYETADAMVAWCRENNIPVRGHCVFWAPEKWQPRWLLDLEDAAALRPAVEARIAGAVGRYAGQLAHWDVNNEMLHGSFFADRLGDEIRPWMFRRAHEIDPGARLFVNDFNILSVDQDFEAVEVDAYIRQIQELLRQGAPIHGVGVQGHIWGEPLLAHPERLKDRLDKLATLGLPIWITEFDSAEESEAANAEILDLVYRTAYSHPAVEGILAWVFWAGNSWRGAHAGLARRDWTLTATGERYEALMREWSTLASGVTDADGTFACDGFHGHYAATVHPPASEPIPVAFTLPPGDEPLVVPVAIDRN